MRIGDLAGRTGASARSLRYYEEQRLFTSTRSPSGQRHYTESDVDRVGFIQGLYAAGLSSRTIAELQPCADAPSEANSDAALARMARERERISAQINELLRARDTLDEMTAIARAHRDSMLALDTSGSPSDERAVERQRGSASCNGNQVAVAVLGA